LEPGKSGENQIRLEVPLIRVPPEETPVGPEREVPLMDVDSEFGPVSATVGVVEPTSTDGRELALPPPLDGATELPKAKKRRVMFADE